MINGRGKDGGLNCMRVHPQGNWPYPYASAVAFDTKLMANDITKVSLERIPLGNSLHLTVEDAINWFKTQFSLNTDRSDLTGIKFQRPTTIRSICLRGEKPCKLPSNRGTISGKGWYYTMKASDNIRGAFIGDLNEQQLQGDQKPILQVGVIQVRPAPPERTKS